MTFYDFLKHKAALYGHQCHSCGQNDGYFALNSKCNICQAPMLHYGNTLDTLFSFEVFREFIDNYVKKGSVFDRKQTRELFTKCIIGLKNKAPETIISELQEIQRLFRSDYIIEGRNDNWSIVMNNKATEIYNYENPKIPIPTDDPEGFIGLILAIQAITIIKLNESNKLYNMKSD